MLEMQGAPPKELLLTICPHSSIPLVFAPCEAATPPSGIKTGRTHTFRIEIL